jgi:excisionase family DNA binding protein
MEAAEYLGLSIWTLRGLIWGGEIPMVRFARKQYVDVRDLDGFIEEHKTTYL